jgi:transposase
MIRTFEERLTIVSQAISGKSIAQLSVEYHLHTDKILEWVRKYDRYGENGLMRQANIRATGAIKEKLVRLILDIGVPLSHIVINHCVSRSALERWVRLVRKLGYTALYQQSERGRSQKDMGRPKKKAAQTGLEKFQEEIARLKAENALLKKVKALVEEQQARTRLIGRQPSKN